MFSFLHNLFASRRFVSVLRCCKHITGVVTAFSVSVTSCTFLFRVAAESQASLSSNQKLDSFVLSRCLQWQLDANLSVVNQLLREYELNVHRLSELLDRHADLLRLCSPESENDDPTVADEILSVRSEWNNRLNRIDQLELALQSGIGTLRSATETVFMSEDLLNRTYLHVPVDNLPGLHLSAQASRILHAAETELTRLSILRKKTSERWFVLVSEHIINCTPNERDQK